MTGYQVSHYLYLLDRRLTILTSNASWRPEDGPELAEMEWELQKLRELADQELKEASGAAR